MTTENHDHESSTTSYQPRIINHVSSTTCHQPRAINHVSSITWHQSRAISTTYVINHVPSTTWHQPCVINHVPSTTRHQPRAINHVSSTTCHQSRAISTTCHQPRVINQSSERATGHHDRGPTTIGYPGERTNKQTGAFSGFHVWPQVLSRGGAIFPIFLLPKLTMADFSDRSGNYLRGHGRISKYATANNEQTNEQTNGQHTDKHIDMHAGRQTCKQTCIETYIRIDTIQTQKQIQSRLPLQFPITSRRYTLRFIWQYYQGTAIVPDHIRADVILFDPFPILFIFVTEKYGQQGLRTAPSGSTFIISTMRIKHARMRLLVSAGGYWLSLQFRACAMTLPAVSSAMTSPAVSTVCRQVSWHLFSHRCLYVQQCHDVIQDDSSIFRWWLVHEV